MPGSLQSLLPSPRRPPCLGPEGAAWLSPGCPHPGSCADTNNHNLEEVAQAATTDCRTPSGCQVFSACKTQGQETLGSVVGRLRRPSRAPRGREQREAHTNVRQGRTLGVRPVSGSRRSRFGGGGWEGKPRRGFAHKQRGALAPRDTRGVGAYPSRREHLIAAGLPAGAKGARSYSRSHSWFL